VCTNYIPSVRHELAQWGVAPQALPSADWPSETFPGYDAPILLWVPGQGLCCRVARFGLVPRWCQDARDAAERSRGTYNARSETAASKPSFRGPWRQRQWALAPMQAFFDPCWEDAAQHGGRPVRWRMGMADGEAFAVAGLWEHWQPPEGGPGVDSFTLLTVNADGHAIMGRMHRPGDEKRMPAILPRARYADWLQASVQNAATLLQPFDASAMGAEPAPRGAASANLSLF